MTDNQEETISVKRSDLYKIAKLVDEALQPKVTYCKDASKMRDDADHAKDMSVVQIQQVLSQYIRLH
ncbi:MAG: hypothetical protein PHF86_03375 [Candidatus Nanoarchaeia archaeon]|jgi:hypothetical protein|nr:hypothetical protein [Candidatus Nanoarchaeia archaeon]